MAGRPGNDDVPEDEDVLGDEVEEAEDEGEGEDLMGPGMMADYEEQPELDQYDPDMLDQEEHAPMSMAERRAAEEAMDARDRREREARLRRREDDEAGAVDRLLGRSAA